MRKVQATEAKTRLAELLRSVEHGETVAITRHGATIAHLVPAHTQARADREAAVDSFLKRRASWEPTGMFLDEIVTAHREGRRL